MISWLWLPALWLAQGCPSLGMAVVIVVDINVDVDALADLE